MQPYMLFGYRALNEQPLLVRLRPAAGIERIVVIAESTKQFVCKSVRPDFTFNFFVSTYQYFLEIGSRNSRKLSRSIQDFNLHDEITPSDSNARFIVFLCFLLWHQPTASVNVILYTEDRNVAPS